MDEEDINKIKSREQKIKDFSNEMYSIDNVQNIPYSAIVQMQSFRSLAGFHSSSIFNQDKWLGRISINQMLNVFAEGFSHLYNTLNDGDVNKLLLMGNLLLEGNHVNNTHFETVIKKLLQIKNPPTQFFSKVLQSVDRGSQSISGPLLGEILLKNKELMAKYFGVLKEKTDEEMDSYWLTKASSQSRSLYTAVCEYFGTVSRSPSAFVKAVHKLGNIIPLYPEKEQHIVVLCNLDENVGNQHQYLSVVVEELRQLWLLCPESVLKLIAHFPVLSDWILECSNHDDSAKRLCLHFLNDTEVNKNIKE